MFATSRPGGTAREPKPVRMRTPAFHNHGLSKGGLRIAAERRLGHSVSAPTVAAPPPRAARPGAPAPIPESEALPVFSPIAAARPKPFPRPAAPRPAPAQEPAPAPAATREQDALQMLLDYEASLPKNQRVRIVSSDVGRPTWSDARVEIPQLPGLPIMPPTSIDPVRAADRADVMRPSMRDYGSFPKTAVGAVDPAKLREHAVLNVKEMKRRNTHDSTWDIMGHRPEACAKIGPLIIAKA